MIYLGQILSLLDQKNWTFGDFFFGFSSIVNVILLEKAIPHIIFITKLRGKKKSYIADPNERNKSYRRPTGENAAVTFTFVKKHSLNNLPRAQYLLGNY
jgi:hypothetical protein